jgi:hypothetical protein
MKRYVSLRERERERERESKNRAKLRLFEEKPQYFISLPAQSALCIGPDDRKNHYRPVS